MTELALPVKPIPASRPRVSRWGTYYGKNYTTFREEAAKALDAVKSNVFVGPLCVVTELVLSLPKTTCRLYPRGDNDNFEKGTWDAITKSAKVWEDDDQIVLNITHKRFTVKKEEPGIYLTIYELEEP